MWQELELFNPEGSRVMATVMVNISSRHVQGASIVMIKGVSERVGEKVFFR